MNATALDIDIQQQIEVKRPAKEVFEAILSEITEEMKYPDGRSMNMKLERHPGGRWYRDLGEGAGHLWGFVQTYRPTDLLELIGPTMMSYPVMNHVEFRLSEIEGGTRLSFRHRAIGAVPPEHRDGMEEGWGEMIESIRKRLENA